MKYYFIETLGDLDEPDLCILDKKPDDIGVKYSCMVFGRRIADVFPSPAVIRMSPDREGLKLSSLLGNTSSFLIVDNLVKDVIKANSTDEIEYLAFNLLDHKGRVHSSDYFIINPIGSRDCLNHELSDIEYFEGDTKEVVDVHRFVLDPEKLSDQPVLFRIKEEPSEYVIGENLLQLFKDNGFTNIVVKEIEQKELESK